MKSLVACAMATVLTMLTGCNQQMPGGPGASTSGSSGESTTTANKPMLGEAVETFDVNAPMLPTRIKQGDSSIVTFSVSRGKSFSEDVTIRMEELPKGVTCDPSSVSIKNGEKESTITFLAADDAEVGDFTAKVVAHPTKGSDATSSMKFSVLAK